MAADAYRGLVGIGMRLLPRVDGTAAARRNAWTSWVEQASARREREAAVAFVAARAAEQTRTVSAIPV